MTSRVTLPVLLVACLLLLSVPPARPEPSRAPGVPDLNDPATQAELVPLGVGRFNGDLDFPTLLFGRVGDGPAGFLLVVFDARNGKGSWSPREDAAIFYLFLSDGHSAERAILDEGFARAGQASGRFIAAGPDNAGEFATRLEAAYRRARATARSGTAF